MSTQSSTAGILEDLVNQFSDPMSCLRELIQNSIDAGSGEIEVEVEYDGDSGAVDALMVIHVNDYGEGMSQEIIETKLTRLFSSGKDEDFTKIGRFGIGFVSVFALLPEVVCVDTGRAGEYWRVLFKGEDKTYDLLRLNHPVEGTQVRIFKRCSWDEYQDFNRRAREVISYWCRHVKVPISVGGEELNEPFELSDVVCAVHHEEEGTRVVAGFTSDDSEGVGGYFNRGLTLRDGFASEWRGVSFKLDSRYLEHTLTRDQVLKDRHYHKAHTLLEGLIQDQLVEHLSQEIERAAAGGDVDRWYALLGAVLGYMSHWGSVDGVGRWRCIRTMYGEALDIKTFVRMAEQGKVWGVKERSVLSDAFQKEQVLVEVPVKYLKLWEKLLSLLQVEAQYLDVHWGMLVWSQENRAPGVDVLREEVRLGLRALGGRTEHVEFVEKLGKLEGDVVHVDQECGVPVEVKVGEEGMGRGRLLSSSRVGLVMGYELWPEAMRLARQEPEWAALLIVKALLLQDERGMRGVDEGVLTAHMVHRRDERLRRAQ